ncbi:hypothetical protein [Tropicimonas sp. IMCC34043]|uniref:hypothetical protein n=1 Tax=Tropicimonas sp. IMCC34043 TaxID=2248760 RepID=UPI000E2304CE|nr:hypothetical protein [Tropicimonas sp. IMCC34043]
MSRRIALLSNCLANQNAKVAEYEVCPGAVVPLLDLLRTAGFTIQQMPCPEMTFLGCSRWWQVREQYDTPGYRRHCRLVAGSVADVLERTCADGCDDLVLLGVDGSPSSGVTTTDHGTGWGGRPGAREVSLVAGKGVWIEVLEQVLRARGLPVPRVIGIGTELPGYAPVAEMARLAGFLGLAEVGGGGHAIDPERGRRILIVPDAALSQPGATAGFEAAGWGLLQLPPAGLSPEAAHLARDLVADQAEDYRRNGYRVAVLAGPESDLFARHMIDRGLAPFEVLAEGV